MRRGLTTDLTLRFFGSVICGIAIALIFAGLWILFNPFDPKDTWSDVWHFVLPCGVIGAIAGTIVGALWSLLWAIELWLPERKSPDATDGGSVREYPGKAP
jgi:hypothetical protein